MTEQTPKSREELLNILKQLAYVYGLYIDDRYLDDGGDFIHWLPTSMYAESITDMLREAWEAVQAEGEIIPATPEEVEFYEADFQEHRLDDEDENDDYPPRENWLDRDHGGLPPR